MVNLREELQAAMLLLATPVESPPEDAPEGVWVAWMDLMELDSRIGGWVATASVGGIVRRAEIRLAQRLLRANPQWRALNGNRYDALEAALGVLLGSG